MSAKPATPAEPSLTPTQAHALLDYLTHAQTLHEFTSLKVPGRVAHCGPPFVPAPTSPSQPPSPILNTLFRRLALSLPGIRDAPPTLWRTHLQGLLEDMALQDLSDSYDKGTISKRKTVGYGIAVVAEYAGRGVFGGMPRVEKSGKEGYDMNSAEDVQRAWDELREGFVYGKDMEDLVDWAAKTVRRNGAHDMLGLCSSCCRTSSRIFHLNTRPRTATPP
jgi:hypothetical protein